MSKVVPGPEVRPGAETSFEGIPVTVVDLLSSDASGTRYAMLRVDGADLQPFSVALERLNRAMTLQPARMWDLVLNELGENDPQADIRYAMRAERQRLLDQGDLALVAVTYPHEYRGDLARLIAKIKDEQDGD